MAGTWCRAAATLALGTAAWTLAATDPRGYPNIWDKTVVATMSEFGRTSKTNGGNGTDHAAASCVFLQGGSVNGGVYNCDPSTWPSGSMFDLEGKFLSELTDYRDVFWEILRDHMGSAAGSEGSVFPGFTPAPQDLNLIG